jgi:hypothetical protein
MPLRAGVHRVSNPIDPTLSVSDVAQWCGIGGYNIQHPAATRTARDRYMAKRVNVTNAISKGPSSDSKLALKKPSDSDCILVKRLKRGLNAEDPAAMAFAEIASIDPGLIARAPPVERGVLRGRGDFLLGSNAVLEIKAPWRFVGDESVELPFKTEWMVQVQLYLELYNREFAYVIAWSEFFVWIWRVDRNPTLINLLLKEVDKFEMMVTTGKNAECMTSEETHALKAEVSAARLELKQLRVDENGAVAFAKIEGGAVRTDPNMSRGIDRIANPFNLHSTPFASRFCRVRIVDTCTNEFWSCFKDGPQPRGGIVRSDYYPQTVRRFLSGPVEWGVKV